jgi:predicted glycosyltransferase
MGTQRILVYSHDTFGLGNIRRMLAICEHLTGTNPELDVLILSGSPLLNAFRIPPRIDYVKLPCLARSASGHYGTKFLRLEYPDLLRMRSNIILNTALDFAPDLVLVDKKPLGIDSELEPCLKLLQRRLNPQFVLLLRDILDSPEATIPVWDKHGYHDLIAEFYHRILVVGDPLVFDAIEEYRFPTASAEMTRYCGYLTREVRTESTNVLRHRLGLNTGPLVLVAAGGGEDGFKLISTYVRGLRERTSPAPHSSIIFCGPEMPIAQRREIQAIAAGLPKVTLDDFTNDMMSYVGAADLVIAMGGYNTVCELLSAGKPALIVPRVEPVREQLVRAEAMSALGLLSFLHPHEITPALLNRRVTELLRSLPQACEASQSLNMGGLEGVAAEVNALLAPPSTAALPRIKLAGAAL